MTGRGRSMTALTGADHVVTDMTDRFPLRCPVCKADVGANHRWWPVVPPHQGCPGTGGLGLVRRHGRWTRPLLTDTPKETP